MVQNTFGLGAMDFFFFFVTIITTKDTTYCGLVWVIQSAF